MQVVEAIPTFRSPNVGLACAVPGCAVPAVTRGWCQRHYRRWARWGDVETVKAHRYEDETFEDRLASLVDVGDCWQWSGKGRTLSAGGGYGQVMWHGRKMVAHRWVWENLVGPIPPGLQLDHLCFNTLCVNPDHLEPVTPALNRQRCRAPKRLVAVAVGALVLVGCMKDEGDTPDPDSTMPVTAVAVATTGTTVADSGLDTTTTAVTTVVASPPLTCGPDADEQHPPPCD